MNDNEHIRLILKTLPEKPGVYHFLDSDNKIIYIGKAKILKRRVSSYFNKHHTSPKLNALVRKIQDIKFTIVDNEWDALLLENSMIKEHKPFYNVLLKDDKSYPWIAITREEFPRVFFTRQPDKNLHILFGPYASVRYVNILLNLINDIFPLRTCFSLAKNGRPCLQYQIKKCAAPCANLISQEDYQKNISIIIDIIKGNNSLAINTLKDKMHKYAETWEFEKAQEIKMKIEILEQHQAKSIVVNPIVSNCDTFSIIIEGQSAFVNFFRINEGAIIQSYTFEISNNLELSQEELLIRGIVEIQQKFGMLSPQIIVPFAPQIEDSHLQFYVPIRGDKKKLLELSERNAKTYMLEKRKRQELIDPDRHKQRILMQLQQDLGMKNLPQRIECFDNSNTQGEEPVAGMVCFINGKPAKKEYRHFLIKTVVGPDDFASMKEVVFRRYSRILEENKPLPDLIIIDGGKGQLHAAYEVLEQLQLNNQIMLIGIAERLEDIYKVGEKLPLFIDKKSESQKLLQQIRDEVHRFSITHHRNRRSKKSLDSELDHISGIGKQTKEKLLVHFKSIHKIEQATMESLTEVVGKQKASILFTYFQSKKNLH